MPKCYKCGTEPVEKKAFCSKCGTFLLREPALIALETELSKNPLFVAWKKSSVFGRLIGSPQILSEEFSEKWTNDVKRILGDGPLSSRYLANLGEYIKEIRSLKGYQHVKKKLEKIGEDFFPTLSEIEFIDFLFLTAKLTPDRIHLEQTFETTGGKNPELKVDYDSEELYFEVTRVMDYKEMSSVTNLYNTFASFQLSMKNVKNKRLRISIRFNNLPSHHVQEEVIRDMNNKLKDGVYFFNIKRDNYEMDISEGDGINISIPPAVFKNKIKDKLDEKTKQFDTNAFNFVVLDVTSVILDLDELSQIVREYFDYSKNTIISGVFLFSKKWTFRDFELMYKVYIMHQPNLKKENVDEVLRIIHGLFP